MRATESLFGGAAAANKLCIVAAPDESGRTRSHLGSMRRAEIEVKSKQRKRVQTHSNNNNRELVSVAQFDLVERANV